MIIFTAKFLRKIDSVGAVCLSENKTLVYFSYHSLNPIRTGGGGGGRIPPCRHIFLDFSKLRSSQGLKLGDF